MLRRKSGALALTGLTARDILVAALFGFEDSSQHLDNALDARKVQQLRQLASELCAAVHPLMLSKIAYGLPTYLIGKAETSVRSGLGAFLSKLIERRDGGWPALFEGLAEDLTFEDLETLLAGLHTTVRPPRDLFGRLRDETLVSLEGTLMESSLAAGSAMNRRRGYLEAIAHRAYQSEDLEQRELGARLRRTDIAVVAKRHAGGMLIGADVNLDADGMGVGVSVPGIQKVLAVFDAERWLPVDQTFLDGVERGRLAALNLLRTVGAGRDILERVNCVTVELRGVLPPVVLTDGSAGLAIALTILSKISNLAMPRVVASGSFDAHGRIEPMDPETVRAKVAAVLSDGLNDALIAFAPAASSTEGLTHLSENTLATACQALWGEEWNDWTTSQRSKALERYGLQDGWRNGIRPDGLILDGLPVVVPMPQAEILARHFIESSVPRVAYLGGPAQSGKTWIAQEIEQRVAAKDKWNVLVLTPATQSVPTSDELIPTVKMLLAQKQLKAPLLVILDGLEWDAAAEDLEDDLFALRDSLGVSVLAVIRSDESTDWETEHGLNVGSVVGEAQVRQFCENLVKAHPHFQRAGSIIGTVQRAAGGNLWWLVRLANLAVGKPTLTSAGQLVMDYCAANFADVSGSERREAGRLAALSLAGVAAPPWFLSDRYEAFFRRLGAHRNKRGEWWLSSRAAAESVLALSESALPSNVDVRAARSLMPTLVAQFVRTGIESDRRDEIIWALERLRRTDEDLLGQVLRFVDKDIDAWTTRFESPGPLARLFDAVQDSVSDGLRLRLAQWLVKLLTLRMSSVPAGQLAKCLNLLRQHRFLLERESPDEDLWGPLVDGLEVGLSAVLAIPATSRARTSLLRALWRMHDERSHRLLLTQAEQLLKGQDVIGPNDYRLALEFIELNAKALVNPVDLSTIPAVVQLAEHELPTDAGLLQYVSRLLLRVELGLEGNDWAAMAARFRKHFQPALNRTSPLELTATLRLLADFHRSLAVKLFTGSDFTTSLVRILTGASATEAGTLIAVLSRVHGQTARNVLYLGDVPRAALASALASRIQRDGDAKGAGRLLKAALTVDTNFGTIHEGFARAVADFLGPGFFELQFVVNPQTSVLLHLLNGMLGAGVGFSETIRETALHGIIRNIRNNYNEWPPRLALFLIAHPEWGEWFASSMAGQISEHRLLETMRRSRNIEALAAFHELGSFLHPSVAKSFTSEPYERVLFTVYRADRPEVLTRAMRAISQTLRRSGERAPGKLILSRASINWEKQLAKASTPGDLAEAIRGLTALDRDIAATVVTAMSDKLLRRAQRALQQLPQTGVELLDAVEEAAPGRGRDIVTELQKRPGAWNAVMEQIGFEQNPQFQGTAYHMLAELGGMPREQVRQRVFDQWMTRIHTLSTPTGLLSLLRAFAAWDEDWGREAAAKLNVSSVVQRLAARMAAGASSDLDRAEPLLGALFGANADAAGRGVIEALKRVRELPRRLGLSHSARLLAGLRVWDPDFGQRLAAEVRGFAVERVESAFVLNDAALWLDVGWVACNTLHYGAGMSIEIMPWSYEVPHPIQVNAWGAGWLVDSQWAEQETALALDSLREQEPPNEPWAAAAVLTIASRAGQVEKLLREESKWRHVVDATPYHLEALISAAENDSALLAFISNRRTDIREKMMRPHLRLHPARQRIESLIQRFA